VLIITQIARHELALELQPRDEEEDRQQPVGRPGGEGQVEVQCCGPDAQPGEVGVRGAPRRVGPEQRQRRRGDEQQSAGGLGAQQVADAARLRPRATAEQAGAGRRGVHPGVIQRDRRTYRRPGFPAHPQSSRG
jgi:hypothetical protein